MQDAVTVTGIIVTSVGVLGTFAGVFLIHRQLKVGQRLARGEFIRALEQDFRGYQGTYEKITHFGPLAPGSNQEIQDSDVSGICLYLSFFEKLAHLNRLGLLELEEISHLFSYRFFAATNNPLVQKKILYSEDLGEYFLSVFELHCKLTEYRRRQGKPIPFEEYQLQRGRSARRPIQPTSTTPATSAPAPSPS